MIPKVINPEEFGKAFIPKGMRASLINYLQRAGISEVPYRLIGWVFYMGLAITYAVYFFSIYPNYVKGSQTLIVFLYTAIAWTVIPLAIMTLFFCGALLFVDLRAYNRTKQIEDHLQDFLRFVSENLKGGMPFEKAIWGAIKPEFGLLSNETRLAAKRVMTGRDIEEAISEFTSKYDSPMLHRSFDLIVEGLKGGGKTAELIDRIVENIEETKELKREMIATNLNYVIFITFIVIIITPGLFTLSYQFLTILKGFSTKLGGTGASSQMSLPINFGAISLDPGVFKRFSMYTISLISVFSSMMISIMQNGNIKGGVKYIPFFALASVGLYLLFMHFACQIFGSIFV